MGAKNRAPKKRTKKISKRTLAERRSYADLFFRAAGTTLLKEDHDKLDLNVLLALKQLKDGDLSDSPRMCVVSSLCALLYVAHLFPESAQIRETARLAYVALAFVRQVAREQGVDKVKLIPGVWDALDFGIELYCQAQKLVSARELLSAHHKANYDLQPIVDLVRGKKCSLVLPRSSDKALKTDLDDGMNGRRGTAWIHDAPTPGRYVEDERGDAWVSDTGVRIAIEKATPVVWES